MPITRTSATPALIHEVNATKNSPRDKSVDANAAHPAVKKKKTPEKNKSIKEKKTVDVTIAAGQQEINEQKAREVVDNIMKNNRYKDMPAARSSPYTREEFGEVKKRLYRTKDDL